MKQAPTDCFKEDELGIKGPPTVESVDAQLHLSTKYLGSLLKQLTRLSAQQLIDEKLIERAKRKLSTTELSVSQIAYEFGFEHPRSCSKLFKTRTEQSPLGFWQSFNRPRGQCQRN